MRAYRVNCVLLFEGGYDLGALYETPSGTLPIREGAELESEEDEASRDDGSGSRDDGSGSRDDGSGSSSSSSSRLRLDPAVVDNGEAAPSSENRKFMEPEVGTTTPKTGSSPLFGGALTNPLHAMSRSVSMIGQP
jgi:hypothetical protein